MEFKILNEKGESVAEFRNEKDRDDCLEHVFQAFYDDVDWKKS